ncbi:MAG TPA: ester cyclase [Pyrinomonadaceae bacterium]|jgi:predicted ester cyclase
MLKHLIFSAFIVFLIFISASSDALAQTKQDDLAVPETLIVPRDITAARREVLTGAARKFYIFWNNGDEKLLGEAISDKFFDHTLPAGRPQGPAGPLAASKAFLAAVPDLKVTVVQQILAVDRVVSHLRFTGHFTGVFKGVKGKNQPVDFIATDILRVENGKITDNWHIEDNLTFLQQIGFIPQ